MLLMDNRKRIQLAISVLPVGAIVSCVGKLIPVCGCLAPDKRQHRRPPGGALIKTALLKMSKAFECVDTKLLESRQVAAREQTIPSCWLLVFEFHEKHLLITFRWLSLPL